MDNINISEFNAKEIATKIVQRANQTMILSGKKISEKKIQESINRLTLKFSTNNKKFN